ncbi:hypothetical protein [Streptomyces sp. NPDC096095]|uniref:hypothetical protein n=1 Tax=Streptomyces sp. NPDC096095 TaxID=3155545 RepID=UPI00331835DB
MTRSMPWLPEGVRLRPDRLHEQHDAHRPGEGQGQDGAEDNGAAGAISQGFRAGAAPADAPTEPLARAGAHAAREDLAAGDPAAEPGARSGSARAASVASKRFDWTV